MLTNAKPGERFVEGDAYDVSVLATTAAITFLIAAFNPQQISRRCRQVQPRIQKLIQEAAESKPEQMGMPPGNACGV